MDLSANLAPIVAVKMLKAKMCVLTFLLPLFWTSVQASSTVMTVNPGGVYDRVQVAVRPQDPPENCTQFLQNLEVGTESQKYILVETNIAHNSSNQCFKIGRK